MAKPTPDVKSIVIIGGSWGGVATSHYLLHHLIPLLNKTSPSYEVVLISSASQAFDRPACPRALISDSFFPQEKLFVSVPAQFTQYPPSNFRFVHATATALDTTARTVTISSVTDHKFTTIPFHALVIATGATAPSPLLGLSPTNDTPSLRASWAAVRAVLPSARHIVIAGGGPTGVEVAGELAEHLNGPMSRAWVGLPSAKAKSQIKVQITIVTASKRILPGLRESLSEKAEVYLAALGVTIRKGVRVVKVTPEGAGEGDEHGVTEVVLSDGETIQADVYIPCVGVTPNTGFMTGGKEKGLLTGDGRVETNAKTLRVDGAGAGARIYAIGDASNAAEKPGVHNTLSAVPVLVANMKKDLIGGEGADREFEEDKRETQLVPIGKSKGVGAMKGWWLPSLLVWALKGRDYWLWTTGGVWSGKAWEKEQ